jgi:hypothetical protein
MSPELCLCSKNLGLLHLSHTDWLRVAAAPPISVHDCARVVQLID